MKPLLDLAKEIRDGIPSSYHVKLENRLAIAWGEQTSKRLCDQARSRAENLSTNRENCARTIYLQV